MRRRDRNEKGRARAARRGGEGLPEDAEGAVAAEEGAEEGEE